MESENRTEVTIAGNPNIKPLEESRLLQNPGAVVREEPYRVEPPLVKKMRNHYGYFGGLSLLYGILFTFCMYRNPNGITYPVFVCIMIAVSYLLLKKIGFTVKRNTMIYIAGMILLGIGTAMTTSGFLVFFNSVGILLLFLTAMLHQFYEDGAWSFPAYVKKLLMICIKTLGHIFYPFTHGFQFLAGAKDGRRKDIMAILSGVLIAVVLLIFVLPMLLRSDMIFAGIFKDAFENIQFGTFFGIVFMILAGFVSSYAFFSALCSSSDKKKIEGEKRKNFNSLIGITFTAILAVIYVMYAVIQVMYLFLRVGGGLPDGVTYAEYARQGFFELLFVGIINFILVLACMYLFEKNKVLYGILTVISGCTFIMIASAVYRMMLYVQVYHFTFLRMLVLWFLAVLALIMAGVIISIYRRSFPLFRYIVAVVGCGYILFSFAKPDRLIAEYNISHMESVSEQDLYYMIYGLSDDAAPALAKLNPEKIVVQDVYADHEEIERQVRQELRSYFNNISHKYDELSLRQLNLSKIQAEKAAEEWEEEQQPII